MTAQVDQRAGHAAGGLGGGEVDGLPWRVFAVVTLASRCGSVPRPATSRSAHPSRVLAQRGALDHGHEALESLGDHVGIDELGAHPRRPGSPGGARR